MKPRVERPVEHLVSFGFKSGFDMLLRCYTRRCPNGAPAWVRDSQQFREILLIRLHPATHQQNKPRFTRRGLYVTLSFGNNGPDHIIDEFYFPWWSIISVEFYPIAQRQKRSPK